jgi:hypothetical protein
MDTKSKKWNDVVNELLRIREKNSGLLLLTNPEWKNKININRSDLRNSKFKSSEEFLKIDPKLPSIYKFEVRLKSQCLKFNKSKILSSVNDPKIKLAKMPDDFILTNRCTLYCGSVEKDLHSRLKQHLGFSSKSTYSLQLRYWLAHHDLDLEFHYIQFEPLFKSAIKLIEASVSKMYQPLIGKQEIVY